MRQHFVVYIAALAVALGAACPGQSEAALTFARLQAVVRDGDLIFQTSRSAQSAAIAAVSSSRYTHVGLVFGASTGALYVVEAVQPVRRTNLATFIKRGANGHFMLMRLRDDRLLAAAGVRKLREEAESFLGRSYDGRFEWSDTRIYCSELVWKAYERALSVRLSEPQRWRDLDLSSEAARALAVKRLGRIPEPDALIVTPARLTDSELIRTVLAGRLDER